MMFVIVLILLAILSLYITIAVLGAVILLLPWVLIGLLAGMIASAATKQQHSTLENIGIGLVGSVVGGIIYEILTDRTTGGVFSPTRIAMSIIGAIIFLLVLNAYRNRN